MFDFSAEIVTYPPHGYPGVRVTGVLDRTAVEALEPKITRAMESERSFVVIDIAGVDFIYSSGIGLLLSSTQRCREQGKELAILNANENVLDTMKVTGVDDFLLLVNSLDELEHRKV